mmetsp:Transcript_100102/g.289010  ORF Transcript_100102/g.289010 Transcript_100102/m.289010 type:complete len:125 (+) Transcript_100102:813-1187(+)
MRQRSVGLIALIGIAGQAAPEFLRSRRRSLATWSVSTLQSARRLSFSFGGGAELRENARALLSRCCCAHRPLAQRRDAEISREAAHPQGRARNASIDIMAVVRRRRAFFEMGRRFCPHLRGGFW